MARLAVPPDAIITVHLINARCTVRVLALPAGPRLAGGLDPAPRRLGRVGGAAPSPSPRVGVSPTEHTNTAGVAHMCLLRTIAGLNPLY
jgi:hypothetical protein